MNVLNWLKRGGTKAMFAVALLSGAQVAWAALGASVTLATGSPTDIYPGETTTLRITLSNSNSINPITGVGFSNTLPGTLPNGLKVAGAPSYTCTDPATATTSAGIGALTAVTGTQAVSLVGGSIPAKFGATPGTRYHGRRTRHLYRAGMPSASAV